MAQFEKPVHGQICWRELNTKNLQTAEEFYQKLFGWRLEQSKNSAVVYKEIIARDRPVGGMMAIDECWGEHWEKIPSAWLTYIAVDDIAAVVEKIRESGGSIRVGPFEAPGVGKMAVVLDPAGIPFSVIQFP